MKSVVLPQTSIYTGNLILVNAKYPYQENAAEHAFAPVNVTDSTALLERNAVTLLSKLMAELNGWKGICAVSGLRSMQEQQKIYTQSLKDNGIDFTQKFVALPGHSEHQTGLAIDLALKQGKIDFIRPDFPYTGICQNFRQRSILFGFIERYPHRKESITGIAHEPWHFRYVGVPHAEIMEKHGFVLEEYIEFLKQYRCHEKCYYYHTKHLNIAVSYLKAEKAADTRFEIDDNIPFSVSGNNVDGFIITEWREQNGGQ